MLGREGLPRGGGVDDWYYIINDADAPNVSSIRWRRPWLMEHHLTQHNLPWVWPSVAYERFMLAAQRSPLHPKRLRHFNASFSWHFTLHHQRLLFSIIEWIGSLVISRILFFSLCIAYCSINIENLYGMRSSGFICLLALRIESLSEAMNISWLILLSGTDQPLKGMYLLDPFAISLSPLGSFFAALLLFLHGGLLRISLEAFEIASSAQYQPRAYTLSFLAWNMNKT